MKKTIITIILLILLALIVVLYRSMSNDTFKDMANETDTAVIVKSFLNKMIPHHQEAVDSSLKVMNDLEITDPQVRIFAANVVDNQSFEISKMQSIYREYLGEEYTPTVVMNMNGSTDKTAELKGDALAKTYTKNMITHHEDAIKMAQDYMKLIDKVRSYDSNTDNGLTITNSHPAVDESYALAQQIVETQTKEIETLKGWKF